MDQSKKLRLQMHELPEIVKVSPGDTIVLERVGRSNIIGYNESTEKREIMTVARGSVCATVVEMIITLNEAEELIVEE